MNAKWYISTLFLIFTLLGTFQQQVSIPNQEIVLEFVDENINKNNIENTIDDIKEKLLNVGVSNITIEETKTKTLKISYYSTVAIDNIREALVKDTKIVLNKNSENKDKNSPSYNYNIDIYELTDETGFSDLDYSFVFEIKLHSDRFTTNNYFAFIKKAEQHKTDQLFKTSFKANKNNPFTKDRTSCKEPEVRAGPKNYIG
jgi:hypothetical protein